MAKGLPRFFVFGPLAFHAYPGAGERPVPPWMLERLAKAAGFIVSVLKPDGRMPQFGDNDSGRFLKIHQPFRAADEAPNASFPDAFREDILDLRHAVAAQVDAHAEAQREEQRCKHCRGTGQEAGRATRTEHGGGCTAAEAGTGVRTSAALHQDQHDHRRGDQNVEDAENDEHGSL